MEKKKDLQKMSNKTCKMIRYILEAQKRALAKKKKLRSLGKRAQSADSEDEMEVDGENQNQTSKTEKQAAQ